MPDGLDKAARNRAAREKAAKRRRLGWDPPFPGRVLAAAPAFFALPARPYARP